MSGIQCDKPQIQKQMNLKLPFRNKKEKEERKVTDESQKQAIYESFGSSSATSRPSSHLSQIQQIVKQHYLQMDINKAMMAQSPRYRKHVDQQVLMKKLFEQRTTNNRSSTIEYQDKRAPHSQQMSTVHSPRRQPMQVVGFQQLQRNLFDTTIQNGYDETYVQKEHVLSARRRAQIQLGKVADYRRSMKEREVQELQFLLSKQQQIDGTAKKICLLDEVIESANLMRKRENVETRTSLPADGANKFMQFAQKKLGIRERSITDQPVMPQSKTIQYATNSPVPSIQNYQHVQQTRIGQSDIKFRTQTTQNQRQSMASVNGVIGDKAGQMRSDQYGTDLVVVIKKKNSFDQSEVYPTMVTVDQTSFQKKNSKGKFMQNDQNQQRFSQQFESQNLRQSVNSAFYQMPQLNMPLQIPDSSRKQTHRNDTQNTSYDGRISVSSNFQKKMNKNSSRKTKDKKSYDAYTGRSQTIQVQTVGNPSDLPYTTLIPEPYSLLKSDDLVIRNFGIADTQKQESHFQYKDCFKPLPIKSMKLKITQNKSPRNNINTNLPSSRLSVEPRQSPNKNLEIGPLDFKKFVPPIDPLMFPSNLLEFGLTDQNSLERFAQDTNGQQSDMYSKSRPQMDKTQPSVDEFVKNDLQQRSDGTLSHRMIIVEEKQIPPAATEKNSEQKNIEDQGKDSMIEVGELQVENNIFTRTGTGQYSNEAKCNVQEHDDSPSTSKQNRVNLMGIIENEANQEKMSKKGVRPMSDKGHPINDSEETREVQVNQSQASNLFQNPVEEATIISVQHNNSSLIKGNVDLMKMADNNATAHHSLSSNANEIREQLESQVLQLISFEEQRKEMNGQISVQSKQIDTQTREQFLATRLESIKNENFQSKKIQINQIDRKGVVNINKVMHNEHMQKERQLYSYFKQCGLIHVDQEFEQFQKVLSDPQKYKELQTKLISQLQAQQKEITQKNAYMPSPRTSYSPSRKRYNGSRKIYQKKNPKDSGNASIYAKQVKEKNIKNEAYRHLCSFSNMSSKFENKNILECISNQKPLKVRVNSPQQETENLSDVLTPKVAQVQLRHLTQELQQRRKKQMTRASIMSSRNSKKDESQKEPNVSVWKQKKLSDLSPGLHTGDTFETFSSCVKTPYEPPQSALIIDHPQGSSLNDNATMSQHDQITRTVYQNDGDGQNAAPSMVATRVSRHNPRKKHLIIQQNKRRETDECSNQDLNMKETLEMNNTMNSQSMQTSQNSMAIVNLSPPPLATRVKEESMAFEPLRQPALMNKSYIFRDNMHRSKRLQIFNHPRPINEISEDGKTNSLKSPVKTKLCTTPHGQTYKFHSQFGFANAISTPQTQPSMAFQVASPPSIIPAVTNVPNHHSSLPFHQIPFGIFTKPCRDGKEQEDKLIKQATKDEITQMDQTQNADRPESCSDEDARCLKEESETMRRKIEDDKRQSQLSSVQMNIDEGAETPKHAIIVSKSNLEQQTTLRRNQIHDKKSISLIIPDQDEGNSNQLGTQRTVKIDNNREQKLNNNLSSGILSSTNEGKPTIRAGEESLDTQQFSNKLMEITIEEAASRILNNINQHYLETTQGNNNSYGSPQQQPSQENENKHSTQPKTPSVECQQMQPTLGERQRRANFDIIEASGNDDTPQRLSKRRYRKDVNNVQASMQQYQFLRNSIDFSHIEGYREESIKNFGLLPNPNKKKKVVPQFQTAIQMNKFIQKRRQRNEAIALNKISNVLDTFSKTNISSLHDRKSSMESSGHTIMVGSKRDVRPVSQQFNSDLEIIKTFVQAQETKNFMQILPQFKQNENQNKKGQILSAQTSGEIVKDKKTLQLPDVMNQINQAKKTKHQVIRYHQKDKDLRYTNRKQQLLQKSLKDRFNKNNTELGSYRKKLMQSIALPDTVNLFLHAEKYLPAKTPNNKDDAASLSQDEEVFSNSHIMTLSGSTQGQPVTPMVALMPPQSTIPSNKCDSRTQTSDKQGGIAKLVSSREPTHTQANEKDIKKFIQVYDEHIKQMNVNKKQTKNTNMRKQEEQTMLDQEEEYPEDDSSYPQNRQTTTNKSQREKHNTQNYPTLECGQDDSPQKNKDREAEDYDEMGAVYINQKTLEEQQNKQ